jgi:hypothetical protein
LGLFPLFVALGALSIEAFAIYRGIMGKNMYPKGDDIPLPRTMGRVLYFAVGAIGIYIALSALR